jgi:hypothetical protein
MNTLPQKRQLPKIDELYTDVELSGRHNELNRLLNQPPKPEWVKEHPFANKEAIVNGQKKKVPVAYIPVETIEYLLTSIFIKWRLEVKAVQVIANSVVATVRLYVLDPVTGEWDWQDGVGASPIQTAKGAAATDFTQVNTAAVQMAAPAAETYAFKDAAEKFGKIFGKDINRKDEMNYEAALQNRFNPKEILVIPDELIFSISEADLENVTNIFKANPEYHSNPKFMQLLNARKTQLNGK